MTENEAFTGGGRWILHGSFLYRLTERDSLDMFRMGTDVNGQRCWQWFSHQDCGSTVASKLLDDFVPWQTGPIPTAEEALAAIGAANAPGGEGS